MLADELADLGDARVILHLEHGAGDLVLLFELSEALVGVFVHAAELPHAKGGQAAVAMGLAHADLAVERVALALQADGRGEHQARNGNDGQHAAAEHDVEGALYGAVCQARVVPVLHGLHDLVSHARVAAIHGLRNKRGSHRRVLPCRFVSSQVQIHVPVPRDPPPIDEFKMRMNCRHNVPLRFDRHVQRKHFPKAGIALAHVYQAPAFATIDLVHAGLLTHQRALLNVQHAVFYAGYAVAHHAVVVEHTAVPVLRIVRHGRIGLLSAAGDAAAKAQLGQGPIEQGGIARGDEEVFLVHGFGLERPSAVPLKPELLLHHKSVLHQLVRDYAADLFAGLALFTFGGVDQIPADAAVLAVCGGAAKGTGQLLLAPHCLFHLSPPFLISATHADAGALRSGFSLAARRSRKSTGFCIFRLTILYEQLISVCPDYAKCTASRYISIPLYKNLYLFVQQKKPLNQRLFLFGHQKRRPPFVDGRLC